MSEEFYTHYAVAPVISWVVSNVSEEFIKSKFNDKSYVVVSNEDGLVDSCTNAINWCKT